MYRLLHGQIALLGLTDKPRMSAATTVAALGGMGIRVYMCTGDALPTALSVARQLGISESKVMAGVLPSGKAAVVQELRDKGEVVAMVGDGVNDALALTQADLGVAIGAGTQVAIEAAGMVMIRSDLTDIVTAMHLSRTIFRRIQVGALLSSQM